MGGIVGNFQYGYLSSGVSSYLRFEDYSTASLYYVGANLGSAENSFLIENLYSYFNNFYLCNF